jgi:flagellar assembly factor FliW
MQSIDHQDICFILANPQAFALKTPSSLPLEVLDLFEVNSFEELDVAYIVNIKDSLEQATVNLKSPVIFNPISKKAAQIILNEDLPLRERLISSC